MRLQRIVVQVTPTQNKKLQQLRRTGFSSSALVRRILDEVLPEIIEAGHNSSILEDISLRLKSLRKEKRYLESLLSRRVHNGDIPSDSSAADSFG